MRKSKPKSAAEILNSTLKYLRLDKRMAQYEGFRHWEDIVGPELAAISLPKQISKTGVLSVEVKDSAWSQELNLRKFELIEAYNKDARTATINDIRFVAGNPKNFN